MYIYCIPSKCILKCWIITFLKPKTIPFVEGWIPPEILAEKIIGSEDELGFV